MPDRPPLHDGCQRSRGVRRARADGGRALTRAGQAVALLRDGNGRSLTLAGMAASRCSPERDFADADGSSAHEPERRAAAPAERSEPAAAKLYPLMSAPESARERLLALIDRFAAPRVVVFGDLIADEFVYGRVARVSREAPV